MGTTPVASAAASPTGRGLPWLPRSPPRAAQGLDGHRLRVQQLSSWGWPAARVFVWVRPHSELRVPLSTASEPQSTCRGNPCHGEERPSSPFPFSILPAAKEATHGPQEVR